MAKEKILIVEDNKALSKLIVKKMETSLNFDVVAAYTYKEACELLEENDDYFVALLDLNLPDAPNGEVVDMVLGHKIPSIVLTGSMDKEVREQILNKEVIDYVYKGNIDDVNYIFALIERLHKNQGIKVLVVDDSIGQRSKIKELLKLQMFTVLVAAHGEEALVFLENNPDIKLVLTDFNMPVIDGLELTKAIRKQKNKNELSIIAMTSSNKELISAQFLKIGANDFINKPFSREELACRIKNSLDALEYIHQIETMAHNDFLTGVSNRRYFFESMKAYCGANKEPFVVAMIDIDNFKAINDTYGHDIGDSTIVVLATLLKKSVKGSDIVARFGGEEFCMVLKNIEQKNALEFFVKLRAQIAATPIQLKEDKAFNFTVSMGVAFSDDGETIDALLIEADKALYSAKKNGKNRVEVA